MFGGSLSETHAQKICKIMDLARAERRAGDRAQRQRRRPHPGGRRVARRLCRSVLAQRPGLGRRAADLRHHGPLRRRRGLFARDDRLHLHGEGHELHVRDRPRRGQDRHQRDRHRTKSSAGQGPTPRSRSVADAAFENDIETLLEVRRLFDFLPLTANEKAPRVATNDTVDRREDSPRHHHPRQRATSPTTCARSS